MTEIDHSKVSDSNFAFMTAVVLSAILVIRIISLWFNQTDLFFDEAQYWLWGKEPALGYFSKPPMLGWIIAFFTQICASDSEFCVRLPSPVIHTATATFIYLATARLINKETGFWAALTFIILPGITLSSTLISTDVPLLMFWAGALWVFVKFMQSQQLTNVFLLGIFLGLGLMAKYAMAYFLLSLVLLAIFDVEARRSIFTRKMLFSLLIALLILSPNLWWNYQHQFITASHTGDNIGWDGSLHPINAIEFLTSQFGVFGPIPFAFFCIAIFRFWREGWNNTQKFLVIFSLPILLIVTFQGLMSKAYANWAALTYVAASILVADLFVNHVPPIWNRISKSIHAMIFISLSVAVTFAASKYLVLPNGKSPFIRLQGWHELALTVEEKLDQNNYAAIIGPHRHLTAELVYYLRHRREKVYALSVTKSPVDHYELTRTYKGKPGGDVLLVATSSDTRRYQSYFESIQPAGSEEIAIGEIRKLWFFKLGGYRDSKGLEKATK